ncbi:MAG: 4-(cytidine 5'-diphospho)-2-C-methyl-D-erythritol kinase [Nitrosomonas sp.]|jgi:4-diphosphocytidyl-2-C-methyl-D-erythritol kinase|uniref:4-diphosphocytidyl-2-C-methyl-D-erythritol kinase n=1 Tax=Nitrosomonas oligotropha TaxID=42354 RepID=A0A2T5I1N8_9PROT|nr:4-(cytidine 5'-diphospho)-2-C-methyl-D-erythritol kinase [Nitrosomonas oligotropha]MBK7491728.1 4-(cytidine 5'-diphospho)-2-C-methyl-D-erythritol kinase [Nitrosomonas sp.]MBP9101368.1 4-(cytidine 5'-diphospho)-2-C-methyl-D-erythritol kinase [Nitrosomonas sp.]PTQ77745.1 4-diphosphocytidyl-2-C-methyl-D-erythritol kinase [Nitrosomonas oligotropha]
MFTFPAPAKLNLFLHVVGRRQDGYHLLQTVFRFLDFSDQLSFAVRPDGIVRLHNPIAGVPEEKDLCVRAAKLLQQKTGTTQGVDIFMQKQIPMGGGLGGGSSDAATTLLALNHLWKVNLNPEQLLELGLQLGADVPVFIFGQNAFAEGVGEKLAAIELPPAWYLVLVPPVQVSTAEIFTSKELTRNTIPITIPPFSVWQGHNDLELVVCRAYPEVARCLEWLKRLENTTIAAMSGSGACVFAEFATERAARAAFEQIPDDMKGFVAKGLDCHPMHKTLN